MPCDTIRTVTLEWEKVDIGLLADSLESSGFSVTRTGDSLYFWLGSQFGNHQDGRLTVSEELNVSTIKQNYSRAAIERACKRKKWQTRTNVRTGQISATRRRVRR